MEPELDIQPAGPSIPQTSGLDALRHVRSSAAADDSEDSQTAGFMFGGGKNPAHEGDSDERDETPESPLEDAIELSPDALAGHGQAPVLSGAEAEMVESGSVVAPLQTPGPERHLDIEA